MVRFQNMSRVNMVIYILPDSTIVYHSTTICFVFSSENQSICILQVVFQYCIHCTLLHCKLTAIWNFSCLGISKHSVVN